MRDQQTFGEGFWLMPKAHIDHYYWSHSQQTSEGQQNSRFGSERYATQKELPSSVFNLYKCKFQIRNSQNSACVSAAMQLTQRYSARSEVPNVVKPPIAMKNGASWDREIKIVLDKLCTMFSRPDNIRQLQNLGASVSTSIGQLIMKDLLGRNTDLERELTFSMKRKSIHAFNSESWSCSA